MLSNTHASVAQDISERTALKERLIAKVTHAMEAPVSGPQLGTSVFANMADMEQHVLPVSFGWLYFFATIFIIIKAFK